MKFYRDPNKTSNHPGGHCYWEEATPKAYTLVPIPMLENFVRVITLQVNYLIKPSLYHTITMKLWIDIFEFGSSFELDMVVDCS